MEASSQPAAWLTDNLDVIPRDGLVLDVASGKGRNAVFLAQRGWRVHAIDRDITDLVRLVGTLGERGAMTVEQVDLEVGTPVLGAERYDAVVVFNYLHRPLMPALVGAVRAGGVLIYETFTIGQAARGHPRNPDFLLRDGELPTLVAPLRIIRAREGDFGGRLISSIVAVRDGGTIRSA